MLLLSQRINQEKCCHASEGWHPALIEATLDASLRWHDNHLQEIHDVV